MARRALPFASALLLLLVMAAGMTGVGASFVESGAARVRVHVGTLAVEVASDTPGAVIDGAAGTITFPAVDIRSPSTPVVGGVPQVVFDDVTVRATGEIPADVAVRITSSATPGLEVDRFTLVRQGPGGPEPIARLPLSDLRIGGPDGGPIHASIGLTWDGLTEASLGGRLTLQLSFEATESGLGGGPGAGPGFVDRSTGTAGYRIGWSVARLAPDPLELGPVLVGDSAVGEVQLTNTGDAPLAVGTASLSGDAAFAIATDGDACSGATVAPGEGCRIGVEFAPSVVGPVTGTLTVPTDAPGGAATAVLAGTGAAPEGPGASIAPAAFDFGPVALGVASAPATFTIANTGTRDLLVTGITLADPGADPGAGASAFTVAPDACTTPIAPTGTCTITVTFQPATEGDAAATLTVVTNAGDAPIVATLTGRGTAPAPPDPGLRISLESLDLGSVRIGHAAGGTLTITNTSDAPLRIASVSLAGGAAGGFSVAADRCTCRRLAPGESCTVRVTFRPGRTGARSATLSVIGELGTVTATITGTGEQKRAIAPLRHHADTPSVAAASPRRHRTSPGEGAPPGRSTDPGPGDRSAPSAPRRHLPPPVRP